MKVLTPGTLVTMLSVLTIAQYQRPEARNPGFEVRMVSFAVTNYSGDTRQRADDATIVTSFFINDYDRFASIFNKEFETDASNFSRANVKLRLQLDKRTIYVDRFGYYAEDNKVYSLRRPGYDALVALLVQRIPAPPDSVEVERTRSKLPN